MNGHETFGSPINLTGRRLTLWAWLFALLLVGVSLPWIAWVQRRSLMSLLLGALPGRDALLGGAVGFLAAHLAWYGFLRIPSLRAVLFRLQSVLALETLNLGNIILIALSAGVGEEVFFRGVLQFHLGLFWSSLLFGLAHPLSLAYVIYATLAGFLLGGLVEVTGSLFPAILCHTVLDAVMLYRLKAMEAGPQKRPFSIAPHRKE